MTINVEDGTGISDANSYVDPSFVTSYLTDRNRQTENGWDTAGQPVQEAACIASTDYIEQRWGFRFLGGKLFRDLSAARATLTLTANPLDGETVTIGFTTYTFNTVLGGANSVLIAANTSDSITNLKDAVLATAAALGTTVGIGTVANPDATADEGVGDTLIAEALVKGTAGNTLPVATTVTGGSWSSPTLIGGGDPPKPQPLSFPRNNLFDRDGLAVIGIPLKLQQSAAEYAVRAVGGTTILSPDPIVDPTGKAVTGNRQKLGPIETEVTYEEGGSASYILHPYPAADRLLIEYVGSTGRIVRG